MKRLAAVALLLLLLLLAAAMAPVQAATFRFTEQDLPEPDEALWELYGRWAAHHEVERDPGRFATFKANAHRQHSKNRMGLNVFGDRSFDEFKPCVIEDVRARRRTVACRRRLRPRRPTSSCCCC
jgi:hypothetical protein